MSDVAWTLARADREMLEGWLVGADFPMAPVVRRLLAAYDDRVEALAMLRAAWNHHMDGCAQFKSAPLLDPPDELTMERIREWMNAPSGTASADIPGAADGHPGGDAE